MNRFKAMTAFAAATILLTGCQQYLARQDLIASSSGDAVARNLALQTPDPWPPYVYDTYIPSNGQRQADAYLIYQKKHEEEEAAPVSPLQLVVPQQ